MSAGESLFQDGGADRVLAPDDAFHARPDEVPMPEVRNKCLRCRPTSDDIRRGCVVISPTGEAHHGDGGDTACGIDATGSGWWWPL